jgi:hypothetical protein
MVTEARMSNNEELHNLYSSPDIIRQINSRRMKEAGHVARMGDDRKVVQGLGGRARKKKRPLGRPWRRWEDWIIFGRLAGGCRVDPDDSGQRPVADSCEYGDEPSGVASRGVAISWFPQSLQTNPKVPPSPSRPLASTYLIIHYSLVILFYNTI